MNAKVGNILLVDIGNTSVAFGWERPAGGMTVRRMMTKECTAVSARKTVESLTSGRPFDGAVISSVVPKVTPLWVKALGRVSRRPPLVVQHRLNLGIRLDYPRPETLGADRLVNACAVFRKYGGPAIVADFGTAATFDVVTGKGAFIGGVIAPGPDLMGRYLAERTALLPKVDFGGPHGPVGRNTIEAVRIGMQVGYLGLVRGILEFLKRGLRLRDPVLVATGGYAGRVVRGIRPRFRLDPCLTLHGLKVIYELNRARNT